MYPKAHQNPKGASMYNCVTYFMTLTPFGLWECCEEGAMEIFFLPYHPHPVKPRHGTTGNPQRKSQTLSLPGLVQMGAAQPLPQAPSACSCDHPLLLRQGQPLGLLVWPAQWAFHQGHTPNQPPLAWGPGQTLTQCPGLGDKLFCVWV